MASADFVAIAAAIGGLTMIVYAFWIAIPDWNIRRRFANQLKDSKSAEDQKGIFKNTHLQGASDTSTFVDALTRLAPVLSKLGPSVSALIIATICFALAAATVSANHLVSGATGH